MTNTTGASRKVEFNPDPELLAELNGSTVLIKYGGNAMIDDQAKINVADQVAQLKEFGIQPVIVHGGGPFIKELLDNAGIVSEFAGGHRRTDQNTMKYVEMALNGRVNGDIVKELNYRELNAVGLSGKDGGMVLAKRRFHREMIDGKWQETDIGYVGDVVSIDTSLIRILLDNGYLPVIAPIGFGSDHLDYNINADMFAGHMAGALKASAFAALTDVDGLMKDPDDPVSLLERADTNEIRAQIGKSIQGGMIPKVESCLIALSKGVKKAHIVNGMKPDTLLIELLTYRKCGTTIESSDSNE